MHSPSKAAPACRIYQHIRNLAGITKTLTDAPAPTSPDDDEERPPSLGLIIDSYLTAHGYKTTSILYIAFAYKEMSSMEAFADMLCGKGMARLEAEWIWQHIQMN
jgi:hypothetical protein